MRRHSVRTKAASGSEADLLQRPQAAGRGARPQSARFAHNFSGVPALQTKLKVGSAGDQYEREADRVAEEVMSTPEPRVQRKCGCGGDCGDCKSGSGSDDEVHRALQRKSISGEDGDIAPENVEGVLRQSGTPLDAATRSFMEPRFNHDFTNVRVHSGAEAAEAAHSVGARAYTVGRDIVFGAGEFRPHTDDGRRLLAHELTHVTQQGGSVGARVQRKDPDPQAAAEKPKPGTAGAAPQLEFREAKNKPAGACLVFMHHEEANARLVAQHMHAHCHYNLAIVVRGPKGKREVPFGTGKIDPNELFPKEIAKECWGNDSCREFVKREKNSKNPTVIQEWMKRQFFLQIQDCSENFKLPVIGLHTNAVGDTKRYRRALATRAAKQKAAEAAEAKRIKEGKPPPTVAPKPIKPDIDAIRGKTFNKNAVDKPSAEDTPFAVLEQWLLDNVEGVVRYGPDEKHPKGRKNSNVKTPQVDKDQNELLTRGQTNILGWCSADDNTRCHIGDPERPDNVVWTTNPADFKKLVGKKVNAVLQTETNDTDLSTLFLHLPGISKEFSDFRKQLEKDVPVDKATVERNYNNLQRIYDAKGLFSADTWNQVSDTLQSTRTFVSRWLQLMQAKSVPELTSDEAPPIPGERHKLHFVNIETPAQATNGDEADVHRVKAFTDVHTTLKILGYDFCDLKDPAGTNTSVPKVEAGMKAGKPPPEE